MVTTKEFKRLKEEVKEARRSRKRRFEVPKLIQELRQLKPSRGRKILQGIRAGIPMSEVPKAPKLKKEKFKPPKLKRKSVLKLLEGF